MSERAPTEVDQHIAWLRQYVAAMSAGNWRDMQTLLECQIDKLTAALAAAQRVREGSEYQHQPGSPHFEGGAAYEAYCNSLPSSTEACIDCDGNGRYPSGAACKSCEGSGRVMPGDGIAAAKAALALSPGKVEGWREGIEAAAKCAEQEVDTYYERMSAIDVRLSNRRGPKWHDGRAIAKAIRKLHSPPISSRAEDS